MGSHPGRSSGFLAVKWPGGVPPKILTWGYKISAQLPLQSAGPPPPGNCPQTQPSPVPFLLRSRHCSGALRRAALGWGQGPLPAPGSCWFGPSRSLDAAAQAGGAKPAVPGASGQQGLRPQDRGVGSAAAWVGLTHSQQLTQGILSLGLHPPRSPLGREVVGSPSTYDLPSQLPLRSTCQRSLVTNSSTLWRGLANGQRRAGWGRKSAPHLASPGLEALSHPLPLTTFKPRLCSASHSPSPTPLFPGPPFLHL